MIYLQDYIKVRIRHINDRQPVVNDEMVCYRTINAAGEISHIHRQTFARFINWSGVFEGIPLFLGTVYDYVIMGSYDNSMISPVKTIDRTRIRRKK